MRSVELTLASEATALESRPPLRYAATGTSERRCSPTDSSSRDLDSLLVVLRRVVEVEVVVDLPIAGGLGDAVAHAQEMPGQELAHALEERLARQTELEGQVVLEPLEIGLDGGQEGQQRLRLGGEVQDVAHLGVVEGLDTEAVAHAEQLLLPLVPDRVGEHTPEAVERCRAPAVVRTHDDLRVGSGPPGAPQLVAQLGVVVDLSVVGQPAPGLVLHGLMPGRAGIDDRQPPVAEPHVAALVDPGSGIVGSPVRDEVAHHLDSGRQSRDGLPAQVDSSADSAHGAETAAPARTADGQPLRVQPRKAPDGPLASRLAHGDVSRLRLGAASALRPLGRACAAGRACAPHRASQCAARADRPGGAGGARHAGIPPGRNLNGGRGGHAAVRDRRARAGSAFAA